MYKGRESDCVLAIDIQRIWKSVINHLNKSYENSNDDTKKHVIRDAEYLMESTLELMEILMGYCVRKIQQQTTQSVEAEPSLGLRRHVSIIDENSITVILNKNLKILISEVGKSVEELDKFKSMNIKEYKEYLRIRRFRNFGRNSASNYVNTYKGDDQLRSLSDLYTFEFDHEQIKEETKKTIAKKKITKTVNEEGIEEEKIEIITEEISIERLKKFDDYEELRNSMKQIITKDYKIVEKILIILYNNILKIPQTALQLLDSDKNVNVLFKLCIGSYPVHLQSIAINIVSELSRITSFEIYSLYEEFLTQLRENLLDKNSRNEPLLQGYYENLLRLTREIISCEDQPQAERLSQLLFEENNLENLELLFSVLRPHQTDFKKEQFVQGRLISLKSDIRNLKYILLSRNDPLLYKEYLRRHHYKLNPNYECNNYETTQIFFEKSEKSKYDESHFENVNERFMIFKGWPILCLISGTIKVVKQEEIVFENENPKEWRSVCKSMIEKYDILDRVKQAKENTNNDEYDILKIVYQLVDILQDYNFTEFYEKVEVLISEYLNSDIDFKFRVTNELGEKLTSVSYKKGRNEFKKVSSDNTQFKKFSNLLQNSNERNIKERGSQTKFNPKNIVLSQSLAAKEIIDTKIYLSFNDFNSNDKEFCSKLLIKRIVYTFNKLKSSSLEPTFDSILSLFLNISNRASGFRATKLQTRLNLLIDKIGDDDKLLEFVKEILDREDLRNYLSDLTLERNLIKIHQIYEVAFLLSKKIKNQLFYEDLAYRIFPIITELTRIYSQDNKFEESAYSVNLILLLCKKFKESVQLLNELKTPLDLTDESERISEIFRLIDVKDIWDLTEFNVRLNDNDFYSIFNNLFMNIILNCKIDLEKLKEKHPKHVKRIKRLHYYDREMKKDTEIARDLYIASKFFEHAVHRSDEKPELREALNCVAKTFEVNFNDDPIKVNLNGYKRWIVSTEECFESTDDYINIYKDKDQTQKVLGFSNCNEGSTQKSIFKEKVCQLLSQGNEFYITYDNSKDFYHNGNDSYDGMKFKRSLSILDNSNREAENTSCSNNIGRIDENFFLYKGCLHLFEENSQECIRYAEGITMSSGEFFYKQDSNEILTLNYRYNTNSMFANITFATNDRRCNAVLKHFKIPGNLKVLSMSHWEKSVCVVLLEGNKFGVLKSKNNNWDEFMVDYLVEKANKKGFVKIDTSDNHYNIGFNIYNMPENQTFLYINIIVKGKYSFLQIEDQKKEGKILYFFKDKEIVASINFEERTLKKVICREASTRECSYYEYYFLLDNGELYYYQKENKDEEKFNQLFIKNSKFKYKITSKHDEFTGGKFVTRLHIRESFNSFIDNISYQTSTTLLIVKYKEKQELGDFYNVRVHYDKVNRESESPSSDDKFELAVEKEMKYLRLKKTSPLLQENENYLYQIVLTDIHPEYQTIIEDYTQRSCDYRRDLFDDGHKLIYPFVAFYNPVEDKMEGENIQENKDQINLCDIVKKRVVKSKFLKLFEIFAKAKEDLDKEFVKFKENGEKIQEPVKEMKNVKSLELERIKKVSEEMMKRESHFGLIFNKIGDKDEEKKKKITYLNFLRDTYNNSEYLEVNQEAIQKQGEDFILPQEIYLKSRNELISEKLSNLKSYFSDLNPETFEKLSFPTFNKFKENSKKISKGDLSFYFQGKIPNFDNIKSLEKFGKLEFETKRKCKVTFYPDVYSMDEQEWKKFCKETGTLWFSKTEKVTDDILEKPLQELHELTKGKDIEVAPISKFLKYQDMIISKMGSPNTSMYTTRATRLFTNNIYNFTELEKLPNSSDFNKEEFDNWVYAFVWHNFKALQFVKNQPIVENQYWDKLTIQKYEKNFFKCFENQFARHFNETSSDMDSNRIRGENSTYENQEMSLLNQFYMGVCDGYADWRQHLRFYNFYISFVGEPGADAGGLKREYFVLMTNEILDKLGLFIKSPNGVHNLGTERDKLVPDPNAVSLRDMDNFFKVGFALGAVMRSGDILSINLPSIFWKYLLDYDITWEDIKCINHSIYTCLENILTMPETDLEYLDESFVTFLLDGSEVELVPNGKNINLTAENKIEYVNLVKEKNMTQLLPAFQKMKQGFYNFNTRSGVRYQTPKTIDPKLVGMNYVDIEQLKKITIYRNFDENHEDAKRFWRVLETFNQKQLAAYLKYVWGRTRLSHGLSDSHKLSYYSSKSNIPEAHTCFFELDLGKYSSDSDLRKKLLYGVENCNEIAEEGGRYRLDADFGI